MGIAQMVNGCVGNIRLAGMHSHRRCHLVLGNCSVKLHHDPEAACLNRPESKPQDRLLWLEDKHH